LVATDNYGLSVQRARRVRDALIGMGLEEACIKLRYYGESDPLVPTRDGVAKRVNRRVEIEIR
jgi:outer membrane protein OmpA-like peptidoglycan-associated protein